MQSSAVAPVTPDDREAVHVVDLFLEQRRVAELTVRLPPGVVRRHAAGDEIVDVMLEVRLHLARAFRIPVPATEEAAHVYCSSMGRSTRPTACTS